MVTVDTLLYKKEKNISIKYLNLPSCAKRYLLYHYLLIVPLVYIHTYWHNQSFMFQLLITQIHKIRGSWSRDKYESFLTYFFVLSRKMASTFSQHFRIFHKLEKNVFSKNYFFSQKIMHVTSIFFNWYLFRNTNLIYHDEMPKKKMYLASKIILGVILAYFVLFFWPFLAHAAIWLQKKFIFMCL